MSRAFNSPGFAVRAILNRVCLRTEFSEMIQLSKSLHAWKTQGFKDILKHELEQLEVQVLPLQQGLSQSSYATDSKFQVMIISVVEEPEFIRAKTGVFYTGLIPGCSCADDPTPVSEYSEYCELQFDISKKTAEAMVTLLLE